MSAALKLGGMAVAGAVLLALGACTETPQSSGLHSRKADVEPWVANDTARAGFAARGWKGGDKVAWELQIRNRNQSQNEYAR